MSVEELRDLCVKDFPSSARREEIMAGFDAIHDQLVSLGIDGELWIDGSFTTRKMEPDDIDFILVTDSGLRDTGTPEQIAFIDWLIDNERDPKNSFHCDTDVVFRFPEDSPWYEHFTGSVLRHWEEAVYGKSVSSGDPKGIVVISLATKPEEPPATADIPSTLSKGKEEKQR